MKSTLDILEDLELTAGSLAKLEILQSNKNNALLKQIFEAVGNPYVVYYVNKFKVPQVGKEETFFDDEAIDLFLNQILKQLSSRTVTGNAAKDLLWKFYAELNEKQQKWCTRIVLKNLRVGVQETTVNKVWPGTLKSFSVALANTLKSEFVKNEGIKILDNVSYPVRVEPKLDGLRCIAVKNNGIVTFYTRNGTVLDTLPKLKETLEKSEYDNLVLDGECMGQDWNESASIMMSKKEKKDDSAIVFHVFDAISTKDWVEQQNNVPYSERILTVENIINQINNYSKVRQVPSITVSNEDELKIYFQKCMNEGYEGIMLKTTSTSYVFKRSENILKLKPCVTYEGVIVNSYDGRRGTKREGMFSGFEVLLPNGIVTRVGSGFSDSLKAEIQLVGPEKYLGKIAEIEAQPDPLTKDGLTVDGKARFPVFLRIRDTSDVDYAVIAAYEKHAQSIM